MKTKLSPAAVGMFILGALALAVVGFLSFGGSNIFAKPTRFLVYFDESVSGLDPGASVKVNGVRIGRVAAVNVHYDAKAKHSTVQTVCEVDRNILSDDQGRSIDLTAPGALQDLIDHGLRARLNLTGITGLLFVELDFEDPRQYPANPHRMADAYPVVPAIPSPIAEVQASIVEIVANLKQVDFAGLGKELKTLLVATHKKVDDLDVKALADRVGRAADAVQVLASAPEARQALVALNQAVADARALLARIDAQVGPVGADVHQTLAEAQTALKSVDQSAQTVRQFVQAQGNVGDEATRALREISDAATALERLADAIERNPTSLIVGKKKPENAKP